MAYFNWFNAIFSLMFFNEIFKLNCVGNRYLEWPKLGTDFSRLTYKFHHRQNMHRY